MASKLPFKRITQGTNVSDVNVVASENTSKARWDDTNTEIFLKICVATFNQSSEFESIPYFEKCQNIIVLDTHFKL